MPSKNLCVAVAVLGMCVLIACGGGGPDLSKPPEGKIETPEEKATREAALAKQKNERIAFESEIKAMSYAREYVSRGLKAPATASFPSDTLRLKELPEVASARGPLRTWYATGGVDSQNSFGAMLRSEWQVVFAHYEDAFHPVAVSLDGKEFMTFPEVYDIVKEAARDETHRRVQAAEEKSAAREQRKKDEQAAARKAASDAIPDEDRAESLLKNALNMMQANKAAGRKRLQEVADKYPETAAGKKAAKLLK